MAFLARVMVSVACRPRNFKDEENEKTGLTCIINI